ncbi:MAG: septal ring lytic transglycosylase RlpA family protein [Alphaproteobacteria bacterium]
MPRSFPSAGCVRRATAALSVSALLAGVTPCAGAATGQASVYARKFDGRKTASGERYDPGKPTAAHRTLPFGTRVRVRNLANGRSVVVRVNDRGRLAPGRIIDLSPTAARAIGMDPRGVARVEVLRVGDSAPEEPAATPADERPAAEGD